MKRLEDVRECGPFLGTSKESQLEGRRGGGQGGDTERLIEI